MIVTMSKTHIVARRRDRDRLLEALRDLGVVHLAPVDPKRAAADEETVAAIARLNRAIQILESMPRAGAPLDLAPAEAADEVLRIQRESVERASRLSLLYRQMEQLAVWGDVRLEQFKALREIGVEPRFFIVPRRQVGEVRAECVQPIAPWPGKRMLVAVIQRGGEIAVPDLSEPIPLPSRDRPSVRAEAAQIDAALKADAEKLSRLAPLAGAMERERARLRAAAAWTIATRSALADEHLYALQGWVPADRADRLAADLGAAGLDAAVQAAPPGPDDQPPTLVRYPWWAGPIEGLFKILGTVPGYTEFDVSSAFMVFLPLFSAILISDAGYGLMYLALPIIFYRKMAAAGAAALAQLVIVIGACALVWGILTGGFFGFNMCEWPLVGRVMPQPIIPVDMKQASMKGLMAVSIFLGAVHLSLAHLWKAKAAFPKLQFLSEVGWAVWLWGMYGLVKTFLLREPESVNQFFTQTRYPYLFVAGGVLIIGFTFPSRNILKTVGLGLANFLLPMISSFGDSISYVRLMAIGLAGSALALAFNDMAQRVPWPVMVLVLLVAHALNVALSIISLFAHGVRLNMLEFSNNLGMQWSGYPYEPFSTERGQEV